jgi:hypothetical protein
LARAAASVAIAAVALLLPALARADGDPASDYLIGQQTFYAVDEIPANKAQDLNTIVKNANTAGFQIRVALIGTLPDLGSVTSLWQKPQQYAQFLGQELFYAYRGRLLIVMPNGLGYSIHGKPAPNEKRAIAGIAAPGTDGARIAEAATNAVHLLAQAAGKNVPVPKASSGGSATGDRIKIGAIALGAAAIAAAVALVRRTRRAARA